MKYSKIAKAKFIERLNRFVAKVELCGEIVSVHVKNTGRCKELLVKGATVYLEDLSSDLKNRKYPYSLVAVKKGDILINMDSQAPNKVVYEAIIGDKLHLPNMGKIDFVKPETTFEASRFDFFVKDVYGNSCFIEVKGVTLENDGVVSFPDAPTARGTKHLKELVRAKNQGYKACVIFVVQMKGAKYFTPNEANDSAFANALNYAILNGVDVFAYECDVTSDGLRLASAIEIQI